MTRALGQPPRIFVSHSSKDNYFGFKLVQDLRNALGDESAVWYDAAGGLFGGDSWWSKIEQELITRNVFIIVLSPDAMNSRWVRQELAIALNEDMKIIPLLYRESDISPTLKTFQIIPFIDVKYYHTSFSDLLAALEVSPKGAKPTIVQKTLETIFLEQMTPKIEDACKAQDWEDVIDKVNYVMNVAPHVRTAEMYHQQGWALFKTGRLPEARDTLHAALSLVSNSTQRLEVMRDYAAVLNAREEWAELLSLAEAALQLAPNHSWWKIVQQHARAGLHAQQQAPPRQDKSVPPDADLPPSSENKEKQGREGQVFGSYRLLEWLSQRTLEGHILSELYRGEHIYHQTMALVKVWHIDLPANSKAPFLAEVDTLTRLTHTHIMHIIDYGIRKDTPFLVMNPIPKGSLRQLYPPGTKLSLSTIQTYTQELAGALQYAHDHNVSHGNLMPENILVGPQRELLLSDFRIASAARQMKLPNNTIYAAPEQQAGQYSAAGDQYALAVMVYEWLLGRPPSHNDLLFMGEFMQEHGIFGTPVQGKIPAELERILMKSLNTSLQGRYKRIEDFANEVANVQL